MYCFTWADFFTARNNFVRWPRTVSIPFGSIKNYLCCGFALLLQRPIIICGMAAMQRSKRGPHREELGALSACTDHACTIFVHHSRSFTQVMYLQITHSLVKVGNNSLPTFSQHRNPAKFHPLHSVRAWPFCTTAVSALRECYRLSVNPF